LLFTVDARTPVPLPGPLRPLGWLFGGIAIDEFFAAQFESGPLKKLVCDHERSENNKRLKRCKLKLREARAEVRRATEHLEMARNTRDVYLKELLERARWDRYQKEHHIRKPHFLNIPSGREVQNNLHEAERELAHALGHRTKAEIDMYNARVTDRHFRSTQGAFCIDLEV